MKKNSLILLACAALSCGRRGTAVVSEPAPSFRLAELGGKTVSLSDYKGKVVLLNFWATWCDSCREETPALEALYRRHRAERFVLLAPSVDTAGKTALLPFIAKYGPTFPILLSDGRTFHAYGITMLPTSFLIGADGRIAKKYLGPLDVKTIENDILSLLSKI